MNIIVFGGQGRTGSLVVAEALRRGHTVSAFVRQSAHSLPSSVRVIEGDARNEAQVSAAIAGQDVVINIIAPRLFDRKNYDISEVATRNIIQGMQAHGVRRYLGQSGAWATEYLHEASLPMRLGFMLIPMFRGIYAVKKREDALVKASGLDWTLVRCGVLTDKTASPMRTFPSGHYKCGLFEIPKSSRESVARFYLDIITDRNFYSACPIVIK